MNSESERLQSELEPLELVSGNMTEKELKERLATMDAMIKVKAADVEDMQLDLKHLHEKRHAFARRNCKHPKDERYERSCMGREIDIYCGICNECLS